MSERHPNVSCMTTWCSYWEKVYEGERGEKVGGCRAWNLMIATVSGDDAPICMTYRIHSDPSKRGIHGQKIHSSETEEAEGR